MGMKYMGKIENHILNYGYRCVLFRKKEASGKIFAKNFLIRDGRLTEVQVCHIGNRATYVATGSSSRLRDIAKEIRLVFDRNGVLIARRVSPRSPLRLTGKGMGKLVALEMIYV